MQEFKIVDEVQDAFIAVAAIDDVAVFVLFLAHERLVVGTHPILIARRFHAAVLAVHLGETFGANEAYRLIYDGFKCIREHPAGIEEDTRAALELYLRLNSIVGVDTCGGELFSFDRWHRPLWLPS